MDAEKSETKCIYRCVLPQCRGLRFSLAHRFPRNQQRCKLWLKALDNPTLNTTPPLQLPKYYICCRHFRVMDYCHPTSVRLNFSAVPSLNLKTLNELDICRHEKTIIFQEYKFSNSVGCDTDVSINSGSDENSNHLNIRFDSQELVEDAPLLNDNIVSSSLDLADEEIVTTCFEDGYSRFHIVVDDCFIQIKDAQLVSLVKADVLWMRYICKCRHCFDEKENRPFINICDLENDLKPIVATVVDDTKRLDIIWSDGHTSTYNLNQLYEKIQQEHPVKSTSTSLLWNFQDTQYRDDLQPINCLDLIKSHKTVSYSALDRLQKSGVLIINKIPEFDKDSLLKKSIITKLFNHSWSQFTTEKRKLFLKHKESIPFSNCTFESMDKGLQILTVPYDNEHLKIQLTLVDGFMAIEQVSKDAYDFLTQFKLVYSFTNENGYKHTSKQPVILKDSNVERIWFSTSHVDYLTSKDFCQASQHLKSLSNVMKMEYNQWPVELNAQTMVILDNYRICWCLKEPLENCELDCVYMETKHYLSSLNTLRNNSSKSCVS